MKRIWFLSQLQFKTFSIFATVVIAATSFLISPAQASRGGVEERNNTFAVGLSFKFAGVDELCSGLLLAPTIIATAGHCYYSPKGDVATDYIFTAPGQALDAPLDSRVAQPKVVKAYLDPTFNTKEFNNVNDIAFLQLDKALPGNYFMPIATADEIKNLGGVVVKGYGYGKVYETNASYSIYPRMYSGMWKPFDSGTATSNTLMIPSASSVPCKGDSGGPIVATLSSGKQLLVGVLSGASDVVNGCGTQAADGNFYIRLTLANPYLSLISAIYDPAKAPVATPTATPAPTPAKKVTIKCKKGSVTKKVTAVKPACPKGYKLVK